MLLDHRLFGLSKRHAAFLGVLTLPALFSEQLEDGLVSKRRLACPGCSQHCFHVACVVESVCFDRHFLAESLPKHTLQNTLNYIVIMPPPLYKY